MCSWLRWVRDTLMNSGEDHAEHRPVDGVRRRIEQITEAMHLDIGTLGVLDDAVHRSFLLLLPKALELLLRHLAREDVCLVGGKRSAELACADLPQSGGFDAEARLLGELVCGRDEGVFAGLPRGTTGNFADEAVRRASRATELADEHHVGVHQLGPLAVRHDGRDVRSRDDELVGLVATLVGDVNVDVEGVGEREAFGRSDAERPEELGTVETVTRSLLGLEPALEVRELPDVERYHPLAARSLRTVAEAFDGCSERVFEARVQGNVLEPAVVGEVAHLRRVVGVAEDGFARVVEHAELDVRGKSRELLGARHPEDGHVGHVQVRVLPLDLRIVSVAPAAVPRERDEDHAVVTHVLEGLERGRPPVGVGRIARRRSGEKDGLRELCRGLFEGIHDLHLVHDWTSSAFLCCVWLKGLCELPTREGSK